ncbi:MAG: Rod shape-determining protein MreD [Cyclobacteriaceae bacterium]|nr:Rod shape-determining protein MreD [Cyclobacteriaceae bacterium]
MNSSSAKIIFQSVIFFLLQVVIFRNVALFDVGFCFIYIAIILLLPIELDRIIVLLIAFVLGLMVDVFYNSFGIHASTAVIFAFIRYYWANTMTPQGGYDSNSSPNISTMGIQWFSTFAIPLLFIHHFALFFIEAGGFSFFWFTLFKVIISTFFTFLVILLFQLLFLTKKRRV